MANINCVFTIPDNPASGRLTGGFTAGSTLGKDDTLVVTVIHPDPETAPTTLTAMYVFSAKSANQAAPSPFVMGANANYQCVTGRSAPGAVVNGTMVYTFQGMSYSGGLPGDYEFTIVAMDTTVTPAVMWSEDPEFDTSN